MISMGRTPSVAGLVDRVIAMKRHPCVELGPGGEFIIQISLARQDRFVAGPMLAAHKSRIAAFLGATAGLPSSAATRVGKPPVAPTKRERREAYAFQMWLQPEPASRVALRVSTISRACRHTKSQSYDE
jgi:hypothetical protein